jgi:hypothetical protein
MSKRIFIPAGRTIGATGITTKIRRYTWTASRGLFVTFTDGMRWRSEYTLPELLRVESVIEVTDWTEAQIRDRQQAIMRL